MRPSDFNMEIYMSHKPEFELMLAHHNSVSRPDRMKSYASSPFQLALDSDLRVQLRRALLDLINEHEAALARYVAEGKLSVDSCKEYVELFARSLKETMDSHEGVTYLLKSAGFDNVPREEINLQPEWRWREAQEWQSNDSQTCCQASESCESNSCNASN
ncbi:MAG: hypothetical protein V1746_05175 [bacterium]